MNRGDWENISRKIFFKLNIEKSYDVRDSVYVEGGGMLLFTIICSVVVVNVEPCCCSSEEKIVSTSVRIGLKLKWLWDEFETKSWPFNIYIYDHIVKFVVGRDLYIFFRYKPCFQKILIFFLFWIVLMCWF
jgi:hypothetical protein